MCTNIAVLGKKILVLEEEEAILKHDCCIYHSVAHRWVQLLESHGCAAVALPALGSYVGFRSRP